jgi:hypothetical protein
MKYYCINERDYKSIRQVSYDLGDIVEDIPKELQVFWAVKKDGKYLCPYDDWQDNYLNASMYSEAQANAIASQDGGTAVKIVIGEVE